MPRIASGCLLPCRLVLTFLATGCGGDGPTPPPALASITLEPQDTTIPVEIGFPLRATARDASGKPIAGIGLTFSAETPGVVELESAAK